MSNTESKAKDKVYSVNYFNRVGKIEFCRLIFAAANTKFADNMVDNLSDSGKETTDNSFIC